MIVLAAAPIDKRYGTGPQDGTVWLATWPDGMIVRLVFTAGAYRLDGMPVDVSDAVLEPVLGTRIDTPARAPDVARRAAEAALAGDLLADARADTNSHAEVPDRLALGVPTIRRKRAPNFYDAARTTITKAEQEPTRCTWNGAVVRGSR